MRTGCERLTEQHYCHDANERVVVSGRRQPFYGPVDRLPVLRSVRKMDRGLDNGMIKRQLYLNNDSHSFGRKEERDRVIR